MKPSAREEKSDRQIISGVCIKGSNMGQKGTAGLGSGQLEHGCVVSRKAQERQVPTEQIFGVQHGYVYYCVQ
jgi:hypothetical protein